MISVIIPCREFSSLTRNCIKSVIKNNTSKLVDQIVLVNDNSKDVFYEGIEVINCKGNFGVAHARNVGLKNAKNNLVMFLDDDVVLKKKTLVSLYNSIKGEDLDFAFPKTIYSTGRLMHPIKSEEFHPRVSTCFLINKRIVNKMDEFFDEQLSIYLEDCDFFIRCEIASLNFKYVEEAVVIHNVNVNKTYTRRMYYEMKHLTYGYFKFRKFNLIHSPFSLKSFLTNFMCIILNFNRWDWQSFDREKLSFSELFKHPLGSRLNLILEFFNGLFDGFSMKKHAKSKQNVLVKLIQK